MVLLEPVMGQMKEQTDFGAGLDQWQYIHTISCRGNVLANILFQTSFSGRLDLLGCLVLALMHCLWIFSFIKRVNHSHRT